MPDITDKSIKREADGQGYDEDIDDGIIIDENVEIEEIPEVPRDLDKHPRGLYVLFFTEMWERFSYYGMRALLVLYIIDTARGGLGWSNIAAGQIYGTYTGLVYLTPLLGGILADKYLGYRRAVVYGGILMALGHFALAFSYIPCFFLGLSLLILGNGLFKPNMSSMVGALYPKDSKLKDSAYTIFYMGINIGAFLSGLICGYLGETVGWHWGFGAAGFGMLLGLIQFNFGTAHLGNVGVRPSKKSKEEAAKTEKIALTSVEKDRLKVIGVMAFFTIFFWTAFEQAGSSMNIFAYQYTDRYIFGWEMPATWFQSVNPLMIFILAPLFAALWKYLADKNIEPATPIKFSFGLLFLGIGFLMLVMGAANITPGAESASVSMIWLFLAFLFHTIGELFLSPVGLSMVNKLSPSRLIGMMFGVWFLANAAANYVGGAISGYMEEFSKNSSMSGFFTIFVVSSIIAAMVLMLCNKKLGKLMHGVN